MKVKNYQSIDLCFPYICKFMNKGTGYTEHRERTKVGSLYSVVVVGFYGRSWSGLKKFSEWTRP